MIPNDLRRSPLRMHLMLKYRGSSMDQVTKAVWIPKEREFQISGMISKVSFEDHQKVSGNNNGCYYPGSWSLSSPQFLEPSPTGWLDDSSNIFHSKDEKYIPFHVFHASSNIFTLIAVNQSGRKSWLCRYWWSWIGGVASLHLLFLTSPSHVTTQFRASTTERFKSSKELDWGSRKSGWVLFACELNV